MNTTQSNLNYRFSHYYESHTDEKIIQGVAQNSEGYIYLVSSAGITSAENQAHTANLDNHEQCLAEFVPVMKTATK